MRKSILLRLTCFLVIPNIFFWIANIIMGSVRPLFIIDYLIILPFLFIPLKKSRYLIVSLIFFIIFFLDLVFFTRQYFPFIRITDVIFLLKMLNIGPVIYKYIFFIALLVFLLELYLIKIIFDKISNIKLAYIIILSIIFSLFLSEFNKDYLKKNPENNYEIKGIARSYIVYLYKLKDNLLYQGLYWEPKVSESNYERATSFIWRAIEKDIELSPKILLIVTESWGKPLDSRVENFILQPILEKRGNMDFLETSSLNFSGSTVDAELKELCKIKVSNFNLSSLDKEFDGCLGNKLKYRDYNTYSLHGANSSVYDRYFWYKKSGLDNNIFFENINSLSICYSFPGACDKDLFETVRKTFKYNKNRKLFYYWLTLNTHYPYDNRDLTDNTTDCNALDLVKDSEECRNILLHKQFFEELSKLLEDENFNDVEVVIVGDHPPPIIKAIENKAVFKEDTVSIVHFKMGNTR